MRDTQPMTDSAWMDHVHHTKSMVGDVLAGILVGVALALLAVLYFTPCQMGALC